MSRFILTIIIFWVGLFWVQVGVAAALYEAEVSVSSQNEAERAAAMQEALRQVALKVVGNRSALSSAALDPLLKEASTLVQQFRYHTVEEQEGKTATLWVRFDPASVDQALRQQALPVWGKSRPAFLLWVAIKEQRGRSLMDASTVSPAAEILKKQAQVRGIPLIFPLWDLEDQRQLAFTDIWGDFSDSIRAASLRYPAAVQLVGRLLDRPGGGWQARWTLYGVSEAHHWTAQGKMEQVLQAGVNEAVDIIAARVVPMTARDSRFSVQVNVTDVASYSDYARLFSYLKDLSQVLAIQPVQLSPTEVRFRLEVQGDPERLADSILLGRVLALAEGEVTDLGSTNTELNYRLLP